jgi:hypothetical protein
MVFRANFRIPRAKPSGDPGWVDVKAGDTPEQYGLKPEDCVGYLTEVEVPAGLEAALDLASCIAGMMETDPLQERAELWTEEMKPRVRVIEGVIKKDITEAERDEAWEIYNREVSDG